MSDPYGYSDTNDEARDDQRDPRQARAQRPGALTDDERTMGMLAHMIALVRYVVPMGGLIGTFIIWLLKKDESDFIDKCCRESLNFQLTMLIYLVVSILLIVTVIGMVVGIPLAIAVAVMNIIMPIIAGIKANSGEQYEYPFTIRMF